MNQEQHNKRLGRQISQVSPLLRKYIEFLDQADPDQLEEAISLMSSRIADQIEDNQAVSIDWELIKQELPQQIIMLEPELIDDTNIPISVQESSIVESGALALKAKGDDGGDDAANWTGTWQETSYTVTAIDDDPEYYLYVNRTPTNQEEEPVILTAASTSVALNINMDTGVGSANISKDEFHDIISDPILRLRMERTGHTISLARPKASG